MCLFTYILCTLCHFQVLVLLTGGDWDPQYASQWNSYANNLKNLPVDMYSFSVGSVSTQAQLQRVIPHNRDIFRVSSYDTMDNRRPDLVNAIRGGKTTVKVMPGLRTADLCLRNV